MNWRDQIRINRLGEKHELASLPDYWFRPQKYSVEGEQVIAVARQKIGGFCDEKVTRKLIAKCKRLGKPLDLIEDVVDSLTPEETLRLTKSMKGSASERAEADLEHKKAILLYGIGEHNFTNEKNEIEKVGSSFVDFVCEYPGLAIEMITVIEEWNRPLAAESHAKSETLSSGSVKKRNSRTTRKTDYSQTGPTPSN